MKTNREKDLNCSARTPGFRFTARMSSWLDQSAAAVAQGIFFILSAIAPAQSQAPRSPTPAPLTGNLQVETIVKGLQNPWPLAFLPDGRMLITERTGRMRTVDRAGRLSEPLERVPQVLARGQGGLLMLLPIRASRKIAWFTFPIRNRRETARPELALPADASAKRASRTCRRSIDSSPKSQAESLWLAPARWKVLRCFWRSKKISGVERTWVKQCVDRFG